MNPKDLLFDVRFWLAMPFLIVAAMAIVAWETITGVEFFTNV